MQYAASESPAAAIFPFGSGVASNVVPDSVDRAKWVIGSPNSKQVAVYPTLRDNVTFAPVARNETVAAATWYLANGHVINSTQERAPLQFCGVTPGETLGANQPIAEALSKHFALFRTARLTEPLSVGIFYANYFAGWRLGLNFAEARFVKTGAGMFGAGSGVWVVPGRRGACIMEGLKSGNSGYEGGNGVCSVLIYAGAESGGMRFSDRDGHGRNTYSGFVPDGNKSVSMVLADGAIMSVPVIDNVYSVTVKGRAMALIDRNAFGRHERFPLFVNYNMF